MSTTFFIEKNNAAIIQVERGSYPRIVLNGMPAPPITTDSFDDND